MKIQIKFHCFVLIVKIKIGWVGQINKHFLFWVEELKSKIRS